MIEIEYMPVRKIIIHAIGEFTEAGFFANVVKNTIASGASANSLRFIWAKGVIVNPIAFPETPDVVREKMQGIHHYSRVEYVPMPEYKSEVVPRIDNIPYHIGIVKNDDPMLDEIGIYLAEKKYQQDQKSSPAVITT